MEVERSSEVNVKLADNTGKKPETAKRDRPRRKIRRFRNALGRKNYTGSRNLPPRRRLRSNFSKDERRDRGIRPRRRGVKIIIRNLSRNATNFDLKSAFEKIGPLRRCGINWNNLGESRGTAEVEYLYRGDAFRAVKKLDYKSIKGVPMRLEIREGQRRIRLKRIGDRDRKTRSVGGRRFRRDHYRDSRRGNSSYSQRNSIRRRLRNRRRDGSRNDNRYRKY